MVLAAWTRGIPTFVQEQNAIPGITNKILGKVVKTVFTSLPDTQGFAVAKVKLVGNPIRSSIRPREKAPAKFTVLAFGGSQGSLTINKAMAEAAPLLAAKKEQLRIVHQQGKNQTVDVAKAYRDAGIEAVVQPYFDDMPQQYAGASLAVCRAGATSLAELAVASLPAILLPFPFAADNHQEKNADVIVAAGGALKLLDSQASGEAMAGLLLKLMDDAPRLEAMGAAMGKLARPQAADEVVTAMLAATENTHV
jgi:UDP-N-acetylglucosamine--N-acetylmuramyl-(pentapeptide) pyrophosphoryl-undecaprenol N-acetylglucosamine transferase